MVGVVRKCIWVIPYSMLCCPTMPAASYMPPQCSCRVSINGDVTCTEIDHQGCSVMDPLPDQPQETSSINTHTSIVSAEFVGYPVSLYRISISAVLLNKKTGRHRQTEIVVDGYIRISRPGLALVLPS